MVKTERTEQRQRNSERLKGGENRCVRPVFLFFFLLFLVAMASDL